LSAEQALSDARPHTQRFRRTSRANALSPEQKGRQAAVTAAAWSFFGNGPTMIAFLNGNHPDLGGRPLDLAVNSDAGLDAVLTTLRKPVPEPVGG